MPSRFLFSCTYLNLGVHVQDFLEEGQEETGWKLVHGDVFRPPAVSTFCLLPAETVAMVTLAFACATHVHPCDFMLLYLQED